MLVLSLVIVGIVVATPSFDSGLRQRNSGCCIEWNPWAWAQADSGDDGWYGVWAEADSEKERYSGSYDGILNVSASVSVFTDPVHYDPPFTFHSAYCN